MTSEVPQPGREGEPITSLDDPRTREQARFPAPPADADAVGATPE